MSCWQRPRRTSSPTCRRPSAASSKRASSFSAARRRKRLQPRTLFADQIFIGGDDVAAAFERAFDQFGRLGRPADHLDDQVDLRIVDDRTGVAREEAPLERVRAFLERIGDRDCAKLVPDTAPAFDRVALPVETVGYVRTDRPTPEQPDPHGRFHDIQASCCDGKARIERAPRRIGEGRVKHCGSGST